MNSNNTVAKNNAYTIFVVEDSDVYRSILVQELESENDSDNSSVRYKVYGFSSGEECIRNVHLKPDIMIMDYLLNGNGYLHNMNGLELLRQIKEKMPKIEVFVLSCQNNIDVIKEFMNSGIRDYIQKDGIGQHKVKQVIGDFVRAEQEKKRRKHQISMAAIVLLIAAVISTLLFLRI